MKTIAITNLKGGVGKTTTAVNLAAGLGERGQRVLLVDVDSQGHCAQYLGIGRTNGLSQILTFTRPDSDDAARRFRPTADFVIPNVRRGLNLISCDPTIALAERVIAGDTMKEMRLHNRLAELKDVYDVALFDVAPGVELRSTMALIAAQYALVPAQAGTPDTSLSDLTQRFRAMRQDTGHSPEILGVLGTAVDGREKLSRELLSKLGALGLKEAPSIRRNISVAESTRAGQTIFEYAPKSAGAEDYTALTDWVMTRLELK